MAGHALSTAVCSVPAAPQALLSAWTARRRDQPLELALDPRIPHPVQQQLLSAARDAGYRCEELAHPLVDLRRRRTPSLLARERYERRAARQALAATLELAAAHEVGRVVVYPGALGLGIGVDQLERRFARVERLPRRTLVRRRRAQEAGALDALRSCLDPLLGRASDYGVVIAFAGPTIWPHQLPDETEVGALQREFAGAPLITARFADWAHASDQLALVPRSAPEGEASPGPQLATETMTPGGLILPAALPSGPPPVADEPEASASREPPVLRFADCCGLTLRLPPGCGEVDWERATGPRSLEAGTVLTVDPSASAEEIDDALALLAKLSARAAT